MMTKYKDFIKSMTKDYNDVVKLEQNVVYAQRDNKGMVSIKLLPTIKKYPNFIYCDRVVITDRYYDEILKLACEYEKTIDSKKLEDIENHIYSLIF